MVEDLTVLAIPGFLATIGGEAMLLRRRAAQTGEATTGGYERRDTLASLTMGTASLLVPVVTRKVADRIAPQRSWIGRGILGAGLAAAAVTTVLDRLERRAGSTEADTAAAVSLDAHRGRRRRRRAQQVGGAIAVGATGVAACTAWASAVRPSRLWVRRRTDLGTGVVPFAIAVAGWDFIYYWNHRLMHEVRALWAIHVVHHSSQRYNLSTALRQPVGDSLGIFVPVGALCVAGVRPALVEAARGVNLLYQYWIHTETVGSLGPAEEVLNTPSHHRVHHGSNQRYLDRNHGSILVTWDRLFGTFQREEEPVRYGLTRNIGSFNPVRIATHEHRDMLRDVATATSWRDRLSFVVRGPGWAYRRRAELGIGLPAAGAAG